METEHKKQERNKDLRKECVLSRQDYRIGKEESTNDPLRRLSKDVEE